MTALGTLVTIALTGSGGPPLSSYQVQVGPAAEVLTVEAQLPPGTGTSFVFADGGERFVERGEIQGLHGWEPVRRTESGFLVPCERGCRIRYRFLLRKAAEGSGDPEVAAGYAGAYVAPPSTWLIHRGGEPDTGYQLRIRTSPGVRFLSGLEPTEDPETFQVPAANLRIAPMCAFGPWRSQTVDVGGSHITLAIAPATFAMSDAEIGTWVTEAARAVAAYYRGFPVQHLLLLVTPDRGQRLNGVTLGEGGASILIHLGTENPAPRVQKHWLLTHELMHLGFPSMYRRHAWIEEGMAVFGEPIVRTRAGMMERDALWAEWLDQGAVGLPGPGDDGLERTHTWARTYWGGGLFWLLADVTLRERTANARSVDDVLRALVRAGGNVESHWEMEAVLRAADAAAGIPVFSELYRSLAEAPGAPDLHALWKRLGISREGGKLIYDDSAPLASVREAMVGGASAPAK